jgi:hypothetical protein
MNSKLAQVFDRLWVRLAMGISLGVPLTLFSVVFGFLGVIQGLGGLITATDSSAKALFGGMAIASIFGPLGVAGAWMRIWTAHREFTVTGRRIALTLLGCGICSAIAIASYFSITGLDWRVALTAIMAAILGIAFVIATPRAT